jgi:hypothetical protein
MIFLIHNRHLASQKTIRCAAGLLLAGGALAGGGCQSVQVGQKQQPDLVNADPIVVDPAMAARQWPIMAAVYPNFSSTAGYADSPLVASPKLGPIKHAVVETPVFLLNTLLLPVYMIQVNPYAQLEATSFYLPPTYTANPPADPAHPGDFSGGPGTGYTPIPGRAVHVLPVAPADAQE